MKAYATLVLLLLVSIGLSDAGTFSPDTNFTARELGIIAAVKSANAPQFNGPRALGIRPGTGLVCSLAVTGRRPLTFTANDLPVGLTLDSRTGIITGSLKHSGNYEFTAKAENTSGKAEARFRILCGDEVALTPPMGWNSYDAFGDSVVESEVLSNAIWLKDHLQPLGWDTIVIDFRWYDPQPTGNDFTLNQFRTGAELTADAFGRLWPATNRFPSAAGGQGFKPLAARLHAMGLKFGFHMMRGIPRQAVSARTPIEDCNYTAADAGNPQNQCGWCPDMFGVQANAAGQAWYDSMMRLYASWGLDYIKVDDLSTPYHSNEIEMIRRAIDQCGRSIVFSTSPGPTSPSYSEHIKTNANLWRISGDFWDSWPKLNQQFNLITRWQNYGTPGHWPDADMIPLGHICLRSKAGGDDRWTHFTHEEQLTLLSLWALSPSPLMLGMNLPDNDDWTTAILSNPDVLAVNQDLLGRQAHRLTRPTRVPELWMKELAGGSVALGVFNRGDSEANMDLAWRDLGYPSAPKVRDLWLRKALDQKDHLIESIPPHGCLLLGIDGPAESQAEGSATAGSAAR